MLEHIAIIPDGNRRWAKKNNISIEKAYEVGIKKFADVGKWAREFGIKTLTAWGFSTENFRRSGEEKQTLWMLFEKFLNEGIERFNKEDRKEKNQVKINFLGRIHLFPKKLQELMHEVMEKTKHNKPYVVNFMMGYGGRTELVDTINKLMASGKKEVDKEDIKNALYTKGQKDPDLIIRTGGEKRLSGFLPWQSVYSELYFCNKLWPDFSKQDFEDAINDYKKRKRRFGK